MFSSSDGGCESTPCLLRHVTNLYEASCVLFVSAFQFLVFLVVLTDYSTQAEARDLEAFNCGSEQGYFEFKKIPYLDVK